MEAAMQLFISEVLGSLAQLLLFGAIPFIWWFAAARKQVSFGRWLGLQQPRETGRRPLLLLMTLAALAFLGLGEWVRDALGTAASPFAGRGAAGIPAILVYACFHTAFSEELFFRGFLLKRIAVRFGFWTGNIIQAALFGAVHAAAFMQTAGAALLLLAFTGGIGLALGYINEKKAGGSILPGWGVHAVTNLASALAAAF